MRIWNWLTRRRDDHGWPGYIINGRIRTSTVGLIVAFFVVSWVHNTYKPPPPAAEIAPQVVPPGFVPDPEYTWVPRTYVQPRPRPTPTTTTTTTTTTTETSPTEATPGPLDGLTPTTVVDPDGPGPLPPQTITGTPTTSPTETPLPVPNRSGTPTTSTTAIVVPSVPGPTSSTSTPPTSTPPR